MKSRAGEETKSCQASPTLFSVVNAWLSLWMDVSGMGVEGIAGCRSITGHTGGLKLLEMRHETMQSPIIFERLDGEFFEYGDILSKCWVWWHNGSNHY